MATYQQNPANNCECEFTVPIKLNVPITISPQVYITSVRSIKQKLPIFLEPDLLLEPEVRANAPVCYPQNECEPKQIAAQDVLQSTEMS
ncbi:hypothetical protein PI95_027720 [Hassallia byssoidea VB512170]|uniref:Uncharacterized protein n=2 Tax=Hassallia TaxID=482629 RepID=A0A846HFU0_9CYAN|nr:hypothetical protein [Hassalia byssoidea VB512170]